MGADRADVGAAAPSFRPDPPEASPTRPPRRTGSAPPTRARLGAARQDTERVGGSDGRRGGEADGHRDPHGLARERPPHDLDRDPERPAGVARPVSRGCAAVSTDGAETGARAAVSTVAVLTVAVAGVESAVRAFGDLAGTVVLSGTGGLALALKGTVIGLPTRRTGSVAVTVARLAPDAHVVQAPSTTLPAVPSRRAKGPRPAADRAAVRGRSRGRADHGVRIRAVGCTPPDLGGRSMTGVVGTLATATAQRAVSPGRAPCLTTRLLDPVA